MSPNSPAWCEHCMAAAARYDGLCPECYADALVLYPGAGLCVKCHEPVEGPGDIYCHAHNIELECWLDDLADDRPCND